MYAFELHRAKSVADATAMLAKSGGRALAGGQSLIAGDAAAARAAGHAGRPLGHQRTARHPQGRRRDRRSAPPRGTPKSQRRRTSRRRSRRLRRWPRASATAGSQHGARSAARSRTTIRRPTIRPRFVGLNATVVTSKRKIAADDFLQGHSTKPRWPATRSSTAVSFPKPKRAAYEKFRNPASRFALVGVFVAQMKDGSVRVAVSGAGPTVFRCKPIEAALAKSFTPDAAKDDEGGRQRPQHRPARLARVSRASDPGARRARSRCLHLTGPSPRVGLHFVRDDNAT